MRSDVRVGTCLSGGLDSSLIAAHAAHHLGDAPLATFTAVYDDPSLDERRYVELQSARSGSFDSKLSAPSAEGLLRDLDALVRAQDHPIASTSPYAQWAVMQLAGASRMKVLLDGQGADEAIGGYSYFAGAITWGSYSVVACSTLSLRLNGSQTAEGCGSSLKSDAPPSRGFRRSLRDRYADGCGLAAIWWHSSFGRLPETLHAQPHEPTASTPSTRCSEAFRSSSATRTEARWRSRLSCAGPFLDHPLVELTLSFPTGVEVPPRMEQVRPAQGRRGQTSRRDRLAARQARLRDTTGGVAASDAQLAL